MTKQVLIPGMFLSVSLIIAACTSSIPKKDPSHDNSNIDEYIVSTKFPTLQYRAKEVARNMTKSLDPSRYNEIDGNSSVVVEFRNGPAKSLDTPNTRRAQIITDQILAIAKERKELSKPIALTDERAARVKMNREQDHEKDFRNALTVDLPNTIRHAGLGLMSVAVPPNSSYRKLLTVQAELLKAETDRIMEDARTSEKAEVAVSAFVYPSNGERRRLHVDGYDNLADDKGHPISRIQQTTDSGQSFDRPLRESKLELKNASKQLIEQTWPQIEELRAELDIIDTKLSSAMITKEVLKKLPPGQQKDAQLMNEKIVQLGSNLRSSQAQKFYKPLEDIPAAVSEVNALRKYFKAVRESSLSTQFKNLLKNLPESQKSIGFSETRSSNLQSHFSDEALNWLQTTLQRNENFDEVIQSEILKDPPDTPHDMNNLVTGRIELDRAGWSVGDQVEIKILMTAEENKKGKKQNGQGTKDDNAVTKEERVTYKGEAILAGLYRQVGADLIFVRGFGTTEARKWKMNVAAHTDWHYFIRDAGSWGSFWNWLDPGIGVHVASLDQGPDSIEFGMGGNITLFKNLVVGGYGYNFSTNHPYVYIGLNLLDVLNKAKPKLMKLGDGSS